MKLMYNINMFSTTRQKIILGIYIFLILSVPIGSYLVSQRQNIKSSAKEEPVKKETKSKLSPLEEIKNSSSKKVASSSSPTSSSTSVSFGPTLNLTLTLEGRPANNQVAKVFVGIAEGLAQISPKYLLSFTIDLPANGIFKGLSMAGLTIGNQYSAYIKGPAQIATSSAFILGATSTDLNNNQPIFLLSGDLNEDNVVNSADYSIAKAAYGATAASTNWYENGDFNKDGIINSADLGYILKNFSKTGESGVWQSNPATSSGGLTPPQGSNSGYWLWLPDI